MERKTEALAFRRAPRKSTDEGDGRPETGKRVIDDLLQGARQLTLTAIYIGCGATVLVWETVEQWSRSLYQGVRPLWKRKHQEKTAPPRKKKVQLFPIDHYDRLNVEQIVEQLSRLSEDELHLVRDYEKTHRNRNGVSSAIDRRLAEGR